MDPCQVWQEQVSLRLDDMLTDQEAQRLDDHLAQCPDCWALQKDLEKIHDLTADLGLTSAPEGFAQSVMDRVQQEKEGESGQTPVLFFRRRWVKQVGILAACVALCVVVLRPGSSLFLGAMVGGSGSPAPMGADIGEVGTEPAGSASGGTGEQIQAATRMEEPAAADPEFCPQMFGASGSEGVLDGDPGPAVAYGLGPLGVDSLDQAEEEPGTKTANAAAEDYLTQVTGLVREEMAWVLASDTFPEWVFASTQWQETEDGLHYLVLTLEEGERLLTEMEDAEQLLLYPETSVESALCALLLLS